MIVYFENKDCDKCGCSMLKQYIINRDGSIEENWNCIICDPKQEHYNRCIMR